MRYDDLMRLCAVDIAHWTGRTLGYAEYLRSLELLETNRADLFLLDIRNGAVALRPKTAPTAISDHLLQARMPVFMRFFETVVSRFAPELDITIGFLPDDLARGDTELPLLSFQKAEGDNTLLMPDIDTLALNFYESPAFVDELDYAAKRNAAIFVGSTTGVDPATNKSIQNTRHGVDHAPSARIRAAKHFVGVPGVTFKLPGVVQCDSPETESYLRSFEFCQGGSISWRRQFDHRFIISIDGNGATCSRQAISLRSQSVLLKYASPYLLFYTRELVPNVHYLPVTRDEDVSDYLSQLGPTLLGPSDPFAAVSRNANEFYRKYLGRPAQHLYAAVVLNELRSVLRGAPILNTMERVNSLHGALDILVHVSNLGDQWCWPVQRAGTAGSGRAIEAILIAHTVSDAGDGDLEYQCLFQDGEISPWTRSGTLCGERGTNRSLGGLRIRLLGALAGRYTLRYRASFVASSPSGWISDAAWCASPQRAALESFEVELRAR